eukprot:g826.t1
MSSRRSRAASKRNKSKSSVKETPNLKKSKKKSPGKPLSTAKIRSASSTKKKRKARATSASKRKKNMKTASSKTTSTLSGDYMNICLLLLLYTLQGVPMGISAAIPMLLAERKVSMSLQGQFSFASWPFSLKLLWAPVVDSLFMRSWGQRKTWLVPAQLLIGLVMIGSSYSVDNLMDPSQAGEDFDIMLLTSIFFALFFLCATQDIAVDGWALTMLKKENVGYAATCNAAGQTLGNTLSFVGFLTLNSYNIATIGANMRGWGILFLVTTVLIAIMKQEKPAPSIPSVKAAYFEMWSIFRLPAVQSLCLVMFTSKIAFAPGDAMAGLKIQAKGMPKEHMASVGTIIGLISIFLPGVIAKRTAGKKPFELFTDLYIPRIILYVLLAAVIYNAPKPVAGASMPLPLWYYIVIIALYIAITVVATAMFLGQVGLFAKISDPRLGGTYMTLLNTVANLAFKWPSTLVYFLVDMFTTSSVEILDDGSKKTTIVSDGFYVTVVVCAGIGFLWKHWSKKQIYVIENGKREQWLVKSMEKVSDDDDEEAGIALLEKPS